MLGEVGYLIFQSYSKAQSTMGGTIPWPGVAKLYKLNMSGQAVFLHGVYLWVPVMASINGEL